MPSQWWWHAAAAAFLPLMLGGGTPPRHWRVQELHVTAPGDGETVTFTVEEDDEGVCIVTPELVQKSVPQGGVLSTWTACPTWADDIDAYLINSFQMAMLVTSRGEIRL